MVDVQVLCIIPHASRQGAAQPLARVLAPTLYVPNSFAYLRTPPCVEFSRRPCLSVQTIEHRLFIEVICLSSRRCPLGRAYGECRARADCNL